MSKIVTYFSASGVTAKTARQLADVTGAELFEIRPEVPYTRADLDWMNNKSRSSVEMNDKSSRPALEKSDYDFSGYDDVYIGFPIWWYTAPTIINSFIESVDLTGKRVALFATSGGSTINKAVSDLSAQYPELNIVGGKLLNSRVTGDIM